MKFKKRMSLVSEIQIRVALKKKIRSHWQYRKDQYWRKEIRELIVALREFNDLVSQ
jgi:cytochrome b subunit of formate dehydrogenase